MAQATTVANCSNSKVEIVALPADSRTRTTYTFTASAMASMGATSITVGATPVKLYAGDKLTFGSVVATLTADVEAGATSLPVKALSGAVSSMATATTYAMRTLSNADSADVSFSGKSVDTSTFGDGLYTEALKVQVDTMIKVSGIFVGSLPAQTILQVAATDDSEIYFVITDEKGYTTEGVAIVESYDESHKYRDVKKFSLNLKVLAEPINKDPMGTVI